MKVFKIRIDHGKNGDEDFDEIYAPDFSFTSPTLSQEQCETHTAEVDSNGKTRHFLTYGATDFCVHESAVHRLGLIRADLIKLNLNSMEASKLQPPFDKGDWFGIRPTQVIEMHPSAKVTYFTGPAIKERVFRDVKTYVFEGCNLDKLTLFWIVSHGAELFATDQFEAAYRKAGLTGLRFVDTNCTIV